MNRLIVNDMLNRCFMKKTIIFLTILVVLVLTSVVVPPAFADDDPPATPEAPPSEAFISIGNINFGSFDGSQFSDLLIEAFANVTGLYVSEIELLLDKDMNFLTIAILLGYTGEDLDTLMEDLVDEVLDLAVEDEIISQGVADAILGHLDQLGSNLSLLEGSGLTREEFKELLDSGMTICDVAYEQDLAFDRFFLRVCAWSVEDYQNEWERRYFMREDYKEALMREFENLYDSRERIYDFDDLWFNLEGDGE